jgi:hypothetical protein
MNDITLVTGLFDIGRGKKVDQLAEYQQRPFKEYLKSFERVLALDVPMCVYIEPQYEDFVWKNRDTTQTSVIVRDLDYIRTNFPFYNEVQRIRLDPKWRARAAWLAESPQANLELYNPIVMSKMGMLNDQQILNPFGSEHYLWIDAGLHRTCGGYLDNPYWISRITSLLEKFLFVCFPYIGSSEIHGFERDAMAKMANTDYIRRVARGGLFGGTREYIIKANKLYYELLEQSFSQGEMGTEESIFTIMSYLHPEQYDRFEIEGNGLIGPLFEALEKGRVPLIRTENIVPSTLNLKENLSINDSIINFPHQPDIKDFSTACYILTFNKPKQLQLLIDSWQQQTDFFCKSKVYVIDNSTNQEAIEENSNICQANGFLQLLPVKGNIGICGGRQLAAELFEASSHDYMFFLEDDMLLSRPNLPACRAGFNTWVEGLYDKLLKIMYKEEFDFIKLSFSEFYGINSDQWAWYNVPENVRQIIWPQNSKLPEIGLSENVPSVVFNKIANLDGLSYATGEVYYSNWPQIVGRKGNQKMFLDTKWAHPYEQTWMSHMFQETHAGRLKPAVLLASPIDHRRDFHYGSDERLES